MPLPWITAKKIGIKSESFPETRLSLLSGEVHYWRLDPAAWREVLEPVKELGLKIVSTYVCWDFHEPARGCFDFHGETDPRRNLAGFVDILSEAGFWVIIRPGPYIYSEWRNNGVPDYAALYHRLHPEFQASARNYMEAAVSALKPYFATQGGRIILFQADNEVDPWPHWYTEQLGLGNAPGPFHDFLRERYGGVSALNAAWGTAYQDFEEARATTFLIPEGPERLRRYLDFTRFQHWYGLRAVGWTVDTYRQLGVDIPIYANTYSGFSTQHWAGLEDLAGLAGPDLYPSSEFALRPNEHRNFLEAVRYTRTYSRLPYIPELEAGIWHGWHYDVGTLGPNHNRLVCLSALLAGIAGWNWYMLVNRDNWYMSPINEWGRKRPELFEAFRQIVRLYHELDPAALVKLTETAVTHDPLQRGTLRPGQELLQAIYQADIDYEFYDANRGSCSKPLLFYAGGAWLSAEAQERLREYISNGGHLVCIGAYPRLDDQLQPYQAVQIMEPEGVIHDAIGNLRLALTVGAASSEIGVVESPWLFNYATVPGEPVIAERLEKSHPYADELHLQTNLQAGNRYTIGYTQVYGQGRLTLIGLAPSAQLLLALHRFFNIPIPARAHTPGIATAIFRREEAVYLVAVNYGEESRAVEVELSEDILEKAHLQVSDMVTGKVWEINCNETHSLVFGLPRKDGTVLKLIEKAR